LLALNCAHHYNSLVNGNVLRYFVCTGEEISSASDLCRFLIERAQNKIS